MACFFNAPPCIFLKKIVFFHILHDIIIEIYKKGEKLNEKTFGFIAKFINTFSC